LSTENNMPRLFTVTIHNRKSKKPLKPEFWCPKIECKKSPSARFVQALLLHVLGTAQWSDQYYVSSSKNINTLETCIELCDTLPNMGTMMECAEIVRVWLFGRNRGKWISEDGKQICEASINETTKQIFDQMCTTNENYNTPSHHMLSVHTNEQSPISFSTPSSHKSEDYDSPWGGSTMEDIDDTFSSDIFELGIDDSSLSHGEDEHTPRDSNSYITVTREDTTPLSLSSQRSLSSNSLCGMLDSVQFEGGYKGPEPINLQ